ncbi:MAG: aldolase/citrate lyase family protein [Eubacteriales bacterium]
MNLKLLYITNSPEVAKIAEDAGVDRIFVDLETLGKNQRQFGRDTVKSAHAIADISKIKAELTTAEVLVRVNPINDASKDEIDAVIATGADVIMLPMITRLEQAQTFVDYVAGRCKMNMLIETAESVDFLSEIIKIAPDAEYFIGLNDLHLAYGQSFMFEPLADGTVERIINTLRQSGITEYGFGGVARVGEEAILSAEKIITEHHRLNSKMVILSRSFCNALEIKDLDKIKELVESGVKNMRTFEATLDAYTPDHYEKNRLAVIKAVDGIRSQLK